MRHQPYRNDRIIAAIRDLFFIGGNKSFASRFNNHFPMSQDCNGVFMREVPVPMVALVATAVSYFDVVCKQCINSCVALRGAEGVAVRHTDRC
jgi:hypothetical protein